MPAKRKSREAIVLEDFGDEASGTHDRLCEWPDCSEGGEHRAPRSRDELNVYRWFCLDHVREYNKSWNYYEGMSDDEVEEDLRRDTVWNRPTWQLGTNLGPDSFDQARDPFNLFSGASAKGNGARDEKKNGQEYGDQTMRPPLSSEEERAYRTLELDYPLSIEDVKSRYKSLVKEHHPDANKGAKESEERLKEINEAYAVLRASFNV